MINYYLIFLSKKILISSFKNIGKEKEMKLVDKIHLNNLMILKIFEQNKEEYKYLENKILLNYYNMYTQNETQKEVINTVFTVLLDDKFNLIEYSYPLMELIFRIDEKYLEPGNNKKSLNYPECQIDFAGFIDQKNVPQLNKLFLYRFEIICDNYFIKTPKEKNNRNNISEELCGNKSKGYLIEAIEQFYGQKKEKSLKNTCNIYCIAFIRRYLNYYIDILLDERSYQEFGEKKNINDILFYKDSKAIKRIEAIKYYVLKLILKKLDGKWDKFLSYFNEENDKFGFNIYKCFSVNILKKMNLYQEFLFYY